MIDNYNRTINYMRVSITPVCNLRCTYCMPDGNQMDDMAEYLSKNEIIRMCRIAADLGIDTIKITGGEPLVRKDCMEIIRGIKKIEGIKHVTLTSNGVLLEQYAVELKEIGITSINVSLDSLQKERFQSITAKDRFHQVWKGILRSLELGIVTKINCVPQKGVNEDELMDIVELAKSYPLDVRFIEMMPIGHGNKDSGIISENLLKEIRARYPDIHKVKEKKGFGPAHYYKSEQWIGTVGFIDAISHQFCDSCNRIRLTSSGFLKTCLCYQHGYDFLPMLRTDSCDGTIEMTEEEQVAYTDNMIREKLIEVLKGKPYAHDFNRENNSSSNRQENINTQEDKNTSSNKTKQFSEVDIKEIKDKREMFRIGG